MRVEPLAVGAAARRGARGRAAARAGACSSSAAAWPAMATVEALLAHAGAGPTGTSRSSGAEPDRALQPRPAVARCWPARVGEARLALRRPQWFAARGRAALLGVPGAPLDIASAHGRAGRRRELAYDDLVLATGSRPFVPPIARCRPRGVHVFRTLADVRAILEAAARAKRAVVIGGGLLGLEAARGLREHGVHVTVVHLADRLMEQQLDAPAARAAGADAARAADRDVRPAARPRRSPATRRPVEAVALDGGEELRADLVVIAAGMRPEVDARPDRRAGGRARDPRRRRAAHERARRARGRRVRRAPRRVYGLWAPLLRAGASAAGASLAGRPAAFHGACRRRR